MSDRPFPGVAPPQTRRNRRARIPRRITPLVQLTLVRFREFLREPEALFWVFVFPILLAAGLGIAFRNRPADVLKIAAVTPGTGAVAAAGESCSTSSSCRRGAAQKRCAPGRSRCSPSRDRAAASCIRYDDTNPEGRTARMLADRAVQRPPAASIRWRRPTRCCASPARATSIS